MRFRKNAIVVEARQIPTEGDSPLAYAQACVAIADWCGGRSSMMHAGIEPNWYDDGDPGYDHILIPTLEGDLRGKPGDWIVQRINGEFHPVVGDIFAQTYTPLITEIDPSDAEAFTAARRQFLQFQIQKGHIKEAGVNGCFVEDLIDAAIVQIELYQSDVLACPENEATLGFLKAARASMDRRRANRVTQGVANSDQRHVGTPAEQLIAELDPHGIEGSPL